MPSLREGRSTSPIEGKMPSLREGRPRSGDSAWSEGILPSHGA